MLRKRVGGRVTSRWNKLDLNGPEMQKPRISSNHSVLTQMALVLTNCFADMSKTTPQVMLFHGMPRDPDIRIHVTRLQIRIVMTPVTLEWLLGYTTDSPLNFNKVLSYLRF